MTTMMPCRSEYDGKVWSFYADGVWRDQTDGHLMHHRDMIQFASSNHATITHYYVPEMNITVTHEQMLAIRKREEEMRANMEQSKLDVADTVHWCDAGQCWPAIVMTKPNADMGEPQLTLAVMQPDIYAPMGETKAHSTIKNFQPYGFGYGNWHRKEDCTR